MGDFFHGWRRKTGCITLGLACVFMWVWLRGYVVQDDINFGNGKDVEHYHSLILARNGFRWEYRESDDLLGYLRWWNCVRPSAEADDPLYGYVLPMVIDSKWQLCGFSFGKFHDPEGVEVRVNWWTIPYWSITIPSTLISFWLLLSMPRKSNQKKIAELTASDGT